MVSVVVLFFPCKLTYLGCCWICSMTTKSCFRNSRVDLRGKVCFASLSVPAAAALSPNLFPTTPKSLAKVKLQHQTNKHPAELSFVSTAATSSSDTFHPRSAANNNASSTAARDRSSSHSTAAAAFTTVALLLLLPWMAPLTLKRKTAPPHTWRSCDGDGVGSNKV